MNEQDKTIDLSLLGLTDEEETLEELQAQERQMAYQQNRGWEFVHYNHGPSDLRVQDVLDDVRRAIAERQGQ